MADQDPSSPKLSLTAAFAKSSHQPRGYEATVLCLLPGKACVRSDSPVETRLRLWNAYSLQPNGAVSMADSDASICAPPEQGGGEDVPQGGDTAARTGPRHSSRRGDRPCVAGSRPSGGSKSYGSSGWQIRPLHQEVDVVVFCDTEQRVAHGRLAWHLQAWSAWSLKGQHPRNDAASIEAPMSANPYISK